jgi:Na+/H+ antiporter NhaC
VEPHDHVRTQIPFALIAAAVAAVVGFVPAGLGVPAWVSLVVGVVVLVLLPWGFRTDRSLDDTE